jgi:hypothetical protein
MKIIAEGQWLKAETSSHDLRGLSIIADLYILAGAVIAVSSFFLIAIGSFYSLLLLIGAGVIMIAIGHYLDNLNRFSWWLVVISNFVSLAMTSYSAIFIQMPIYDVSFFINVAVSVLCVGYLTRSNVRKLFFEK